jgi:hypothetical protein
MKYQQFQSGAADVLLSRLANVKKSGAGWMASCPAHGGHDCLTVSEKEGRVLVHCFAGCDARDVVESVDLRLSDLFTDSLNPHKRREYQIQSASSARDHAKLIMDIAAAQAANTELSSADLSELADAHQRLQDAEAQLEALGALEPEAEQDNPLAKRLAYDSDSALDTIANQQWLIDGVLPADAFGVIFGPSGAYKSFLAMDMAASIAGSKKWHDRDVDNPGHVIYIGAEGAAGLHLRKKAWEIRYKMPLRNLGILGSAVTINETLQCQLLVDLCLTAADELQEPVRLIVVDTLARTFAGDENSAAEMGAFVRSCDRIREVTGATVLVIHHSGKDAEKGARGSSALRAACDFEFKVTSSGKKVTKLTCTKAKDSDPIEDMGFKLESVEIGRNDSKGRSMVSLVPKYDQAAAIERNDLSGPNQTLNNLIAQEMARTGDDWVMKELVRDSFYYAMGGKSDTSRTQFNRALKHLTDEEWVIMDNNGKITRSSPF